MRLSAYRRCQAVLASLILAVAMPGCGGGVTDGLTLAPVTGVVTLDGKPLPHARLVFQPSGEKASPSVAETGDDGSFELKFTRIRKGAIPGQHTVRVTTAGVLTAADGKETVIEEKLPERYHAKSELKYEVKPGGNRFEIGLESKATAKK